MYAAEHAGRNPDQIAIVVGSTGEQLTFAEYEAQCNRFAHLLTERGLRRGARISVMGENGPMVFVAHGAAERCGLYYIPVNYHFTASEAAWVIDDSESEVVVLHGKLAAIADDLRAQCPKVAHWFAIDPPDELRGFEDLRAAIADRPTTPVENQSLGLAILYSSGTTGRPKGVLRPLPESGPEHGHHIFEFVAREVHRAREGMVYLIPGPNYHASPYAAISMSLRHGGTNVVMDRFDPAQFLRLIEQYRVTHVVCVPTMLYRVLNLPAEVRDAVDVSSLEVLFHTAGPCSIELKNRIIEFFGPVVRETYGATDAVGLTLATAPDSLSHPGTVGRQILGEVLVLDDDGRMCAPDELGEIAWKAAVDFTYMNAADEERAGTPVPASDVRRSGDLGYLDADGFLYVAGRKDFTIVSAGVNIYPKEIEDALVRHERVVDAAVIGTPSADRGQDVKAIVVLAEPTADPDNTIAELTRHCRRELATYKCPRRWEFVAELPRTPLGKLMKHELQARYGEPAEENAG